MADQIASLDLAIDSRSVDQATASLGRLSAQGAAAESAARRMAAGHQQLVAANENVRRSTAAVGHQWQQLQFQLFDIAQTIATMNPLTILLQQGPQVYQALNGPGGVSAGLKNVGGHIASMITPARAVGVALVAAAGVGLAAWMRYDDMQRQVTATLTGMGRGLDTTSAAFQNMARQAAAAGDLSLSQAAAMASAFGRVQESINVQTIGRAVALSKDFAATYTNGDLQAAQEKIVQLLQSGADGIGRWVRQQVLLNAGQRAALDDAERRNNAADAFNIAMDAMTGKFAKASETTSVLQKSWEAISAAVSDMMTRLGPFIDLMARGAVNFLGDAATVVDKLSGRSVGENLSEVSGRVIGAVNRGGNALRSSIGLAQSSGEQYGPNISEMTDMSAATKKLADAMTGLKSETGGLKKETLDLWKAFNPGQEILNLQSGQLKEHSEALSDNTNQSIQRANAAEKIIKEVNREGEEHKDLAAQLGTVEQARKAGLVSGREAVETEDRLSHAFRTRKTELERVTESEALAVRQTLARTQGEKEAIAAEQARLSVAGQRISQAQEDVLVEGARLRVRAEFIAQLRDMQQDQENEAEMIKLERSLIFASNEERARQIALLQTEQQLRKQGFNTNQPGVQARIQQAADNAAGRQTTQAIEQGWNTAKNAVSSFATGFVRDMQNGVKAADALANAAKNIGQSLVQSGIQSGIQGLLSGNWVQAAIGGATAIGGLALGSMGPSEKSKQRKQQMMDAWAQAQQDEFDAIQAQQEATIEAGIAAARAAEEAARIAEAAAEEATRRAEAAIRRMEAYQDRAFNAGLNNNTIEGRLAALARQQQREREEEMRQGGEAINDLVAAQQAEELRIRQDYADQQREVALRQAEEQRRQLEEQQQFFAQTARNIREFLDQIQGGTEAGLSPMARLEAAQNAFNRQVAMARAGDRDALSGITQYAQRLLEAGRGAFASGQGYQDIYQRVVAVLEALMGGSAMAAGGGAGVMGAAANSNGPAGATSGAGVLSTFADVVNEVRQLRNDVSRIGKEITQTNANGFNAVVTAEHETRDAVVTGSAKQAEAIRLAEVRRSAA